MFDRIRISAKPNPNPKAEYCFRTDEVASFFEQVYRYLTHLKIKHAQNGLGGFFIHVISSQVDILNEAVPG